MGEERKVGSFNTGFNWTRYRQLPNVLGSYWFYFICLLLRPYFR